MRDGGEVLGVLWVKVCLCAPEKVLFDSLNNINTEESVNRVRFDTTSGVSKRLKK